MFSEEERAIEEAVRRRLEANSAELIADYRNRFGKVVGTDLARELFPEYAATLETRLRFASCVQKQAAQLADQIFEQMIAEEAAGPVLFTAGGTGAGKTGAITKLSPEVLEGAQILYDSNFNSKSVFTKVDRALSHRRGVAIVFVHRHPVEAYLRGVVPRSLREGRTVPIEGHLRMHRDALKICRKALKVYRNNDNVGFTVLNNTGHEAEVTVVPIEYLNGIRYHDEAGLREAIQQGLDNARKADIISEEIYRASCGVSYRP